MAPNPDEVTRLLLEWSGGSESALQQLMPVVYDELHRIARRYMSAERPGHALQTTALVHEAYLRLINVRRVQWESRTQFFALCANMMRHILVDLARRRRSIKRGAGVHEVEIDDNFVASSPNKIDVVALDQALQALGAIDQRKMQVVELRFFAGLTVQETAEVLKVSADTVQRDWIFAKAWLQKELFL